MIRDCDKRDNEKYFWLSEDGTKIPKHELDDYHICNIVAKYGKKYLEDNGHLLLVRRFEELNRTYDFFKIVKGE